MGQVINTNTPGKIRTQLSKSTVLAIRELMKQKQSNAETKDLIAFIILSLQAIYNTIDTTVEAWEKRGYWIKADRFRMEWSWADTTSKELKKALLAEDWATVAQVSVKIAEHLSNVKIPTRNINKQPWVGAWKIMNQKK